MLYRTLLLVALGSASTLQLGVAVPRVAVRPSARAPVAIMQDVQAPPAPAAVEVGFAGIKGGIERLEENEPALRAILAKAPEAMSKKMSRAEFWTNETATMIEVLNVVGRFQSHTDIKERNEFTAAGYRDEDLRQAGTQKRYQMALKLGCSERYGLLCNVPKLPFTDEKLAASVGLTCEDFADLPVSVAACNIVYDALAESRSGLIPYADFDTRRKEWINDDGSINEARVGIGLAKSRSLVICAWFMFGKGNFVWILVIARALADIRPDLFAALNPATEEGKVLWKAFAIL